MPDVTEAEILIEAEVKTPVGPSCLLFKCDTREYTNTTEKGLLQHRRMKHRISQIDVINYLTEQ